MNNMITDCTQDKSLGFQHILETVSQPSLSPVIAHCISNNNYIKREREKLNLRHLRWRKVLN